MQFAVKSDSFRNVPIIMLTARDSDSDYVSGLALGSDDYFTKPFRPLKLVMRVKAIFRRIDMEQQALKDDKITLGNLSLLSKQRSVLISENEIPLTLIEFEFLDFLFQNQHRAVSRDEILNQVWGYDSMVETRVTDDTVKRLRKKLSDYGSNVFIETVRGSDSNDIFKTIDIYKKYSVLDDTSGFTLADEVTFNKPEEIKVLDNNNINIGVLADSKPVAEG